MGEFAVSSGAQSRALRAAAGLLVAASVSIAGCGSSASNEAKNLVFISIDTLRADHLACYGHRSADTPNMDRLAATGARFEHCTSSCPLTLPSHATMMTGTYPFVHGARINLVFDLAEENLTLAEILQDVGYATHAEVAAAVLERSSGFAQGFDSYNDSFVAEQIVANTQEDQLVLADPQRFAGEVTDAALAFLDSRAGNEHPFFLFVHYFDPHRPYEAPPPYDRYEDGYLAEIAYTDTELGRLLDALDASAFADSTLVVLTSDHGEARHEHNEVSHGNFLYESTIAVPLIMSGPGVPRASTVGAPVGLVDVFPTLLELLDLSSPPDLQGASLVPLFGDQTRDLGLATYAETLKPRMTLGFSQLRVLRDGDWKYIHGPIPELYNVVSDPGEQRNQLDREPRKATAMRQALHDLIADAPALLGRGTGPDVDAEDVKQLISLGYAESQAPSADPDQDPHNWTDELAHFEPQGASPMDRAPDFYLLAVGIGSLRDGRHEDGIDHWSQFLARNPTYAPAHSYLGQCYASLGRHEEAVAPLRQAIALDPARCEDHLILGSMLAESGSLQDAQRAFQEALDCEPLYAMAAFNLARVSLMIDDPNAALEAADKLLALAPNDLKATSLRAKALRGLERLDEAIATLRGALEAMPRSATTRIELASYLQEAGRVSDALDLHDESLRFLPRNVSVRAAAARFWMERGDFAHALEVLEDGLRQRPNATLLAALRVRVLATANDVSIRDGTRALQLAESLLKGGTGEDPRVLAAAATALAEEGDFERATELASEAAALARGHDSTALLERIEAELKGYRAGKPARMK